MLILRINTLLAISCLLFIITSCSQKPKSLNPNGDSELALLMREMYEDGLRTKQQLLDGEQPAVHVKYHQLHTAKATEPDKVASPNYTSFARAYEASVNSLLESNAVNRIESYHSMVDACVNCHKQICPGPTVKIKHLYLSEKELASLVSSGE